MGRAGKDAESCVWQESVKQSCRCSISKAEEESVSRGRENPVSTNASSRQTKWTVWPSADDLNVRGEAQGRENYIDGK